MYFVFRILNGGKWNGLENKSAYDTRRLKTQKMIFRSSLELKAFSRYKLTTNHVENGTFWVFHYPAMRVPSNIIPKRFHVGFVHAQFSVRMCIARTAKPTTIRHKMLGQHTLACLNG